MKRPLLVNWSFAALVLFAAGCATAPRETAPSSTARETANTTALDRYVAKPDPAFTYELDHTFEGKEAVGYVLRMTSQTWRSEKEVDQPVWKHWLTIVVPNKVTNKTAILVISGGGNESGAPKGGDTSLHRVAAATGSITAQINQVPNEPLKFADENRRRNEDAIIAYTWDKFMRTGDEEWPLRLPMTKASVRAMDAVQQFCATPEGGKHAVDNFIVAGASKRGWTTWTVAAVDNRVIGAVPMVIDLLNIVPSFEHHKAVYGKWAPAVGDYVGMKVMDWMGTPEYAALMQIVEPYSYRNRLTMPKLLINACSDQFFIPDSWRFYLKDLQGPTWVRYVPNAGHGLNGSAVDSVQSFSRALAAGDAIPTYTWSFPDDRSVRVETKDKPQVVKLWQVTNPKARDFRLDVIGETWAATELQDEGGGVYTGRVEIPKEGWTAFMVELTFPGSDGGTAPFLFTSPVRVVPDVLPYKYEPASPAPKGFLSK